MAGAASGLVSSIASRVAGLGTSSDVLVSRTVVDLVAGSGLRFLDRGVHQLADGMPAWHVFAAEEDTPLPVAGGLRDQGSGIGR